MQKTTLVRELELQELNNVLNIYIKAFKWQNVVLEDANKRWSGMISSSLIKLYCAIVDNKIVGAGSLALFDTFAFIGGMAVDPEYQQKGIGKDIITYMIDDANKKNIQNFGLVSTKAGEKLYRKMLFTDEGSFTASVHKISLLPTASDIKTDQIQEYRGKILPDWMDNLDKECLEYDRKVLFNYLLNEREGKVFYSETEDGFCVQTENSIALLIATTTEIAIRLIKKAIENGAERAIIPSPKVEILKKYFEINNPEVKNLYMYIGQDKKPVKENLYTLATWLTG